MCIRDSLETLSGLTAETADLLKQQLIELEKLCPSQEEFKLLLSLLTLPSLAASPEYKGWTVQKGRLHCFYQLASWISKILGLDTKLTSSNAFNSSGQMLSKSRLVQLLTKGLLYEHCEAVCVHGQAGERRETSEVLDLYNWIKHQPDSAFQLPPATMQLVVTPKSDERNESPNTSKSVVEASQQMPTPTEQSTDSHTRPSSELDLQNSAAVDGNKASAVALEKESHSEDATAAHGAEGTNWTSSAKEESEVACNTQDDDDDSQQLKATNRSSESENAVPVELVSSTTPPPPTPMKLTTDKMKFDDNFVDGPVGPTPKPPNSSTAKPCSIRKPRSETDLVDRAVQREGIPTSTSAPAVPQQLTRDMLKFDDNFVDLVAKSTPEIHRTKACLLYTSPSPRDATLSRMPSSA